jgi:lysophospholipase L1-like esterase
MSERHTVLLAGLPLALLLFAPPAAAEPQPACMAVENRLEHSFHLPHVMRAIAAKKLTVLVVGSASSTLPGSRGAESAYPARLQKALAAKLPGVAVEVMPDVKAHSTAAVMVQTLPAALAAAKPALVIWQTGTVDAIQAVDPDQFSDTLEQGIEIARAAGADVVLVNSQYSPRTESMIALATYSEEMRWVALQHEVPLFDRFEIMRLWADLDTFDFTSAKNKLDIAGHVHDCIGRLLADLVTEGAQPDGSPGESRH